MTLAATEIIQYENSCELWADSLITETIPDAQLKRMEDADIQIPKILHTWMLKTLILDDRICVTFSGDNTWNLADKITKMYTKGGAFEELVTELYTINTGPESDFPDVTLHIATIEKKPKLTVLRGGSRFDYEDLLFTHGLPGARDDFYRIYEWEKINGPFLPMSTMAQTMCDIENSKLSNQLFKLCEGYGGAFFGAHIVNGKFRYVETPQVAIYVGVNVDFYNFNKIFIDEPAPIASYYSDTYKAGCIYSPLLPGHVERISSLSTNEVKERMYEIISF